MASKSETDITTGATDPLEVWERVGIISALTPHIREVDPGFVASEHDIVFAFVTWAKERSGHIGTFHVKEGDNEPLDLECVPFSTRWNVNHGRSGLFMVYKGNERRDAEHEEDSATLASGSWYAVPIALAPASVRSRAGKEFKQSGLTDNHHLPGFDDDEWDDAAERTLNLTFRKEGRRIVAWYHGRPFAIERQTKNPPIGVEVVCKVAAERLYRGFVRWTGVTVGDQRRVESARARFGNLGGIRRAQAKTRPEIKNLLEVLGITTENITSGLITGTKARLRAAPKTMEEAAENPLAKAMTEVGLPFVADSQDWSVFYADYLYQAIGLANSLLREKRMAEEAAERETAAKKGTESPPTEANGNQPAAEETDTAPAGFGKEDETPAAEGGDTTE
jgi:hypothetical protein